MLNREPVLQADKLMDRDLFQNTKKESRNNIETGSKTVQLVLGGSMSLMILLLGNLWEKKGAPVLAIEHSMAILVASGIFVYMERCYTLRIPGRITWLEKIPSDWIYILTIFPAITVIAIAWIHLTAALIKSAPL